MPARWTIWSETTLEELCRRTASDTRTKEGAEDEDDGDFFATCLNGGTMDRQLKPASGSTPKTWTPENISVRRRPANLKADFPGHTPGFSAAVGAFGRAL
jgi:hypothetical protein